MSKRYYIAGKISGLPYQVAVLEFAQAEKSLLRYGQVFNPIKISPFKEGKLWRHYMIDCLSVLMECDAIYMLRNWKDSKGARIEHAIATELGLEIIYQDKYL